MAERIAERVRKNLNERGTLEVLRRGVEMLGLKEPLALVQFKPALAINPVIQQRYAASCAIYGRPLQANANGTLNRPP